MKPQYETSLKCNSVVIPMTNEFDTKTGEPVWKSLPDGKHEGVWHGYGVTFEHDGINYQMEVDSGVRGWAKVWVCIDGGKVHFEELTEESE